ncbi:MAG TPA: carboxypeptidase-like regulatory domain-containing protein [Pyrinomonadaceae bacterium]|jgi:hypothetical protein
MNGLMIAILVLGTAMLANAQVESFVKAGGKTKAPKSRSLNMITLSGNVRESKKAVAGVYVNITDEKYKQYSVKTDAKGNYKIVLPAGRYRVTSSLSISGSVGCYTVVDNLELMERKRVKLNLDLNACGCG